MGHFLILSLIAHLVSLTNLSAAPLSRRNWFFEQFGGTIHRPSISSLKDTPQFLALVDTTNFESMLSTKAGVIANLGPLEGAVFGARRFFADPVNVKDESNWAIEIARSFTAAEGGFGRLGIEYIHFPNSKPQTGFVKFGFNTGISEFKDSPWILRLNTALFLQLQKDNTPIIHSSVELGQSVWEKETSRLRLGALFSWTYATFDDKEIGPPARSTVLFEHMLFTVGPWAEYLARSFSARISVPWRLWLDKEAYAKASFHYPTLVSIPTASLSFTLFL